MDQAFRYPVVVQVVTKNGYDTFYGYSPDFGIEIYEIVKPGDVSQEFMFHLKLRRLIGESLTASYASKSVPPIKPASQLSYSPISVQDIGSYQSSDLISTSKAAEMLRVHPDTIRSLFDSGVLKGTLTQGGKRNIFLSSIHQEEARMLNRTETRKIEQRVKKKNSKRKLQRQLKEKTKKLAH